MPAVVVGDHGDGGVGDLGLPGALGLAEVGHADDIEAGAAILLGLGEGGEGGPLHVDVGAPERGGSGGLGDLEEQALQGAADRVREADVGDDAAPEEGVLGGSFGAVVELGRDEEGAWLEVLPEGADGAEADDPADAEGLEGIDVGPVVQF